MASSSIIKKVGIIGSGQMGSGIAQVMAFHGFETLLYDISESALENSIEFIKKKLARGVSKEKWNEEKSQQTLSLLNTSSEMASFKDFDIIIEAATENREIKFKIFKQLDEICAPKTILASNTSSISITEIASHTKRADRVIGMHFMNPVPVMKLVEGIRGLETSDEVYETTKLLAESTGKTFVSSKDYPGFIVNRVLMPMINEAIYALYEGLASVEDIDQAMKLGTNQPMGPLTLADFIGLDTCLSIMNVLYDGFSDSKYRPCPLLKQYVASGRLGKKVGKGFYNY